MILLEMLWPALVGLVILCWLGYAPTGGLLPARLGGVRWALLPWSGYAVFTVAAQFLTQLGLDMRSALVVVLLVGTAANGLVWRIGRRLGTPGLPRPDHMGWVIIGLTALVFVLGVLPLWSYGYSTIIGENWDGEIYLALGEYLRTHAQPALALAPGNPLLHTLLVPPYSGRTHGFSYFHAAVGWAAGLSSLAALSPILALLRALAVPASYFFFRSAWTWPARRAAVAAGLLGGHPFLLWITYNTFGMQVPSLGLLPAAVAVTLLALRPQLPIPTPPLDDRQLPHASPASWRRGGPILYAALLTAALAVSYHPALTAWVALVGLGGGAILLTERRQWRRVILAGLGVGVGTLLLSAVAQVLSVGFLTQYQEQTPGLGLTAFTAPTDALGLSLSFRIPFSAGPGQAILSRLVTGYSGLIAVAGLLCAGLMIAWAVGNRRRDPVAVATWAGGLIYLGLFLRPLDYVYGWFKAQSFVAFVLVGATVGGVVGLAQWRGWGRLRGPHVAWAAALLPPMLGLLTLGGLLWQYHWPLRYSRDMVEAASVRNYVLPGDQVFVSGSRLLPGRLFNGLLAYFLRDSDLYGTFHTANSDWDRVQAGGVYTWGVLPLHELPDLYGYRSTDRAWSNAILALYHAPSDLRASYNWEQHGDYPVLAADHAWAVPVFTNSLASSAAGTNAGGAAAPRTLELGVASFTTGTLTVRGASMPVALPLVPGLQLVSFPITESADLRVQADSRPGAVAVRWATLRSAGVGGAGVMPPLTDVLMLDVTSRVQGSMIETTVRRVDTRPLARQADRAVLDVYRSGGSSAADHFGYWAFALQGPMATFRVPPAGGPATGGLGAQPLPADSHRGSVLAARYTASLTFYHGSTVLDTVTDIYTFTAQPGTGGALTIRDMHMRDLPLLFY